MILSVKKAEQFEDNMNAAEITLSVEDMEKLSGITHLPTEYPGWMIANDITARKKLM